MNLLLHAGHGQDYPDGFDYAFVRITPENARTYLQLMDEFIRIRDQVSSTVDSIAFASYEPVWFSPGYMHYSKRDEARQEWLDGVVEAALHTTNDQGQYEEQDYAEAPAGLDADALADWASHTECDRVWVRCIGDEPEVFWSCAPAGTDWIMAETRCIPRSLLEQIAKGENT